MSVAQNTRSTILGVVRHGSSKLQGRALTTYIRRIYFPFLATEPVVRPLGGSGGSSSSFRAALWTFASPHDGSSGVNGAVENATPQPPRLGAALLIPCLADLPAALSALEDAIQQSGTLQLPDDCLGMFISVSLNALTPQLRSACLLACVGLPSAPRWCWC